MSAYKHLYYLVNRCGDRRMGTGGNALAADYIRGVMESAGFRVSFQRFRAPRSIQARYAATMALGLISSLLLSGRTRPRRMVGLALSAIMAWSIAGESSTGLSPAASLVHRIVGTNILCRPSDEARAGTPEVLVVAHYDTVNEGASFDERTVGFVAAGFYVFVAFPALALLSLAPRRWPGRLYRLCMVAGIVSMLQWDFCGRPNAGANDNGSGVAVALDVAERTGGPAAVRERIWFLFTDGEEAGIAGMKAFCEAYGGLLRGTSILNLESVGSGELAVLGREGMLKDRRPPPDLLRAVGDHAASACVRPPLRLSRPAFNTDSLAALKRGKRAVTLVRLDERGLIPGWHNRDALERIDARLLEETSHFVYGLAGHLGEHPR